MSPTRQKIFIGSALLVPLIALLIIFSCEQRAKTPTSSQGREDSLEAFAQWKTDMRNTFAFFEQVEKIETMKSGFFTGDPAVKVKRETITAKSSSRKDSWEEVITGYDEKGNEITVHYSCSHDGDVWKGSLYATYKGDVQLEMHEEIAPSGTKGEEYLIKGNISAPLDTTKTVVIEGLYHPDGSKSRREIGITLTLPAWDIVLTERITSSTERSLIAEKMENGKKSTIWNQS